jgi:hypothetical protein
MAIHVHDDIVHEDEEGSSSKNNWIYFAIRRFRDSIFSHEYDLSGHGDDYVSS